MVCLSVAHAEKISFSYEGHRVYSGLRNDQVQKVSLLQPAYKILLYPLDTQTAVYELIDGFYDQAQKFWVWFILERRYKSRRIKARSNLIDED